MVTDEGMGDVQTVRMTYVTIASFRNKLRLALAKGGCEV